MHIEWDKQQKANIDRNMAQTLSDKIKRYKQKTVRFFIRSTLNDGGFSVWFCSLKKHWKRFNGRLGPYFL